MSAALLRSENEEPRRSGAQRSSLHAALLLLTALAALLPTLAALLATLLTALLLALLVRILLLPALLALLTLVLVVLLVHVPFPVLEGSADPSRAVRFSFRMSKDAPTEVI
jgi:hypothetical protein